MSDEARRARLLAKLLEPSHNEQKAQPVANTVPTSTYPTGSKIRERMMRPLRSTTSTECTARPPPAAPAPQRRSAPATVPAMQPHPAPTANLSGPIRSRVGAPSAGPSVSQPPATLTAEEMEWNRKLRKLTKHMPGASMEAAEFQAQPPLDSHGSSPQKGAQGLSPISYYTKNALKRTVQDRAEDIDSDEDLFMSPVKPARAQQRPQRPALFQDRAQKQSAEPIAASPERDDADAEDDQLTIANATIVAPEFQARPNRSIAATQGPAEPLELCSPADALPLSLSVPASINQYLRDYQQQGVEFLFRQYSRNLGGILADDMGLGKTVQTIAFCAALLGKTGTQEDNAVRQSVAGKKRFPLLVIAPSSVLDNWSREFQTWGAFRTCMYSEKKKSGALSGITGGTHEIMLVSFDTFRKDHEDLRKVAWHAVIVDEAHKLKNENSKTYKACESIATKLRYGLTGTVMQNSYDELWNVLNWAVPNCLGGRTEFMNFYAKPLKRARQISASEYVLGQGQKRQDKLHEKLQHYLLRRRKDNTIKEQMPKKLDHIVFSELSDLQLAAYRRTLASPDFQLLCKAYDECDCGSGMTSAACCHWRPADGGTLWAQFHLCDCPYPFDPLVRPEGCKWHKPDGCSGRLHCPFCLILPGLTILRKISNHLDLIKANPEECGQDARKLQRQEEVADLVLGPDADQVGGLRRDKTFLTISDTRGCGKLLVLEKLLSLWSQPGMDNKVLLFSHSVRMLDIIESVVIRRGYLHTRLDGSTGREDRQKTVDAFNNDPSLFLFLISTAAGGVGLNLASANKVLVVDPSWNPAADLQAIDRAYRLGQKRDVSVYRFVSTGTLEEVVYTRQLYKQQQSNVAVENSRERRYFNAVQKEKGSNLEVKGELFGIGNLFKLTAEKVSTQEIVHAQRQAEANFRIEEYDPEDLADMDLKAAGGGIALDDRLTEDDCIDDLATALARAAMRKDLPADSNPAAMVDDEAAALHVEPRLLPLKAVGQTAALTHNDAMDGVLDLQEAGVLETLRHDQLLGSSRVEKRRAARAEHTFARHEARKLTEEEKDRQRAEQLAAARNGLRAWKVEETRAALERRPASAKKSSGRKMRALESLAQWQMMSVKEMAQQLCQMDEQQRTALREKYAAEFVEAA